ncbi:MAG TPA: hypothetical protein VMV79_03615 [Alphaproteobacteria bacterium]|nr:hypothetical protein [Alphaproteobacteria bacterium]
MAKPARGHASATDGRGLPQTAAHSRGTPVTSGGRAKLTFRQTAPKKLPNPCMSMIFPSIHVWQNKLAADVYKKFAGHRFACNPAIDAIVPAA